MAEMRIIYKGISIKKTTKYGADWFEFVLEHKPYAVPYYEDCKELIDIVLS